MINVDRMEKNGMSQKLNILGIKGIVLGTLAHCLSLYTIFGVVLLYIIYQQWIERNGLGCNKGKSYYTNDLQGPVLFLSVGENASATGENYRKQLLVCFGLRG